MLKDFKRKGSSAGDGAAPRKPYRSRDGRPFENRRFGKKHFDSDREEKPWRGQGPAREQKREGFRERPSFGKRNDRPFERRGDRPFERRGDRPFERRGDRPFERHGDRPFEKRGDGIRKRSRADFELKRRDNAAKLRQERIKTVYKKTEIRDSDEVRLNKFIANSGLCSRREADKYIQAGVVSVNGNIVTELGTKIKMGDDVRFNGERLTGEKKVYILMNKPRDFVTTTSDPHAEKTVMDLLTGCKERVFPVGRLDKSTTGVLLFTNDGKMTEHLTHPSYDKKKIYQVTLDKPLTKEDFDSILKGIWLSDGMINADEMAYVDNDRSVIGIAIHSGRNRIIRRIFESLGYKVTKLDRVYFAGLTKKGLRRGEWRYLDQKEVNILMMGAYE